MLTRIAAAALLASMPLAYAQTTPSRAGNPPNTLPGPAMEGKANPSLSDGDRAFLIKDAQGAAFERQLAEMAVKKAADPAVKRYAEMIVRDHSEYNSTLQTVGQDHGIALPTVPDETHVARLRDFSAKSGKVFDAEFVKEMRQVNAEDADDSAKEERTTMDSGIHNFIVRFKQMDEKHKAEAEKLPG